MLTLYLGEKVVSGYAELGQQSCSCHVPPHAKNGLGVNINCEMSCVCPSTLLPLAYEFLTVERGVYLGLQVLCLVCLSALSCKDSGSQLEV